MSEHYIDDKKILEQRARLEEQYQKKHDKLINSKIKQKHQNNKK